MLLEEIFLDSACLLHREDIEALYFLDKAHRRIITKSFDGKGPMRPLVSAKLSSVEFELVSLEGGRTARDADEFFRYLRNTFIGELTVASDPRGAHARQEKSVRSGLDIEMVEKLREITAFCVIDLFTLKCSDAAAVDSGILDGAVRFREFKWAFARPKKTDGGSPGREEQTLEAIQFHGCFLSLGSVTNAQMLNLIARPGLPIPAICAWLHGLGGAVHYDQPRHLRLSWSSCIRVDGLALIKALEELFVADTESREYFFRSDPSSFSVSLLHGTNQKTSLRNGVGDTFEVDMMGTGSLCITRHSKARIERTSIVTTFKGPKVWDFRTASELDRHLFSNDIYELLARCGLISNEMTRQCGQPMYYDRTTRTTTLNSGLWCCSGTCKDRFRRKRHVCSLYGSWFRNPRYLGLENLVLVLKAVMALKPLTSDTDTQAQLPIKCDFHAQDFVEKYGEMLRDGGLSKNGDDAKSYAQCFYETVCRKYTFDGPCQVSFEEDD